MRFQYKQREVTEQEQLEFDLERYVVGRGFFDVYDGDAMTKGIELVQQHSIGDNRQDASFLEDLLVTGKIKTDVRGRERIELMLKMYKVKREELSQEILPKYDRLIQIYSEQDCRKK